MRKQINMAMYNTLLTHSKKNKIKKSAKDSSVHGPEEPKPKPKIALSILYTTHTVQADDVKQTNTRNAPKK